MKNLKPSALLVAISIFLLPLFAAEPSSPKPAGSDNRRDDSKRDPLQQIEEVRSSLQKQIDELKAENAELKQQVALMAKVLKDALSGAGRDRSSADSGNAVRGRVTGSSRRDVYGAPNSGIVGKVEPGAIVRVLQVVESGGSRWCLCELERGEMYTVEQPARALTRGWVWAQALEKTE